MHGIESFTILDLLAGVALLWVIWILRTNHTKVCTTPLRGPPNPSRLFGFSKLVMNSPDTSPILEEWTNTYGLVFQVMGAFGRKRVFLADPKAVMQFYAKNTTTFTQTKTSKLFLERMFGNGLLTAEGNDHKRQRKSLTPAFSVAAVKKHTSVFYDVATQVTEAWDTLLHGKPDGAVIEVQDWMSRVSLDSIGIAGFSHDFASLKGVSSPVHKMFTSFSDTQPSFMSNLMFLASTIFPIFIHLPTERNQLFVELRRTTSAIASELLNKARLEQEGLQKQGNADQSVIGLLIKGEGTTLSSEEVAAQMNVLLLAGYETTSISLTWALIELCKNLDVQQKLRQEIINCGSSEPTWEKLSAGSLPYLDGVVHETLRLHPALDFTNRTTTEDTILPLTTPIETPTGETVSSIVIAKGQNLVACIRLMNQSSTFWGTDARKFSPERWSVEDSNIRATEIQGHRHLLTFADGPISCLGRVFAITEFKVVLFTLIRNFAFEFDGGVNTEIGAHRSILMRPKVEGEIGAKVPMRVRRVEV